jgi:hypothetical protein
VSQNKVKLTLKLVRISGRMPFIPALNIRSNLQGAKILLDGVDTGRVTNARFVRWKAGTYSVEKEGYKFSPETSVEEIAPHIEKTIDFIGTAQVNAPKLPTPYITISNNDPITPSSTHSIIGLSVEGIAIYYTTDGSEPTEASALYTTPFTLPAGTYTIKARAYAPGYSPSDAATSAEFTVQQILPTESGILHNGYIYHIFEADGELEVLSDVDVELLIVAGGGSGASHATLAYGMGGGGAGGCILDTITLHPGVHSIQIGLGGLRGGTSGNPGLPSVFKDSGNNVIASVSGGGRGGYTTTVGGDGGSGGGSGHGVLVTGGAGIEDQGHNGGKGYGSSGNRQGGGGGGKGNDDETDPAVGNGVGVDGVSLVAGNGGSGINMNTRWDLTDGVVGNIVIGALGWFAGGGGGASANATNGLGHSGGSNGTRGSNSADGLDGTGSGSGGATVGLAGNGASGIVIVRYAI